MTDKTKLIVPRLPRGFEDRDAGEIAAVGAMIDRIKQVYHRYGFDPVETPLFEFTETLGKFLPDTDRPNAGVFSLQDAAAQWLSLRYDLTAPLARYYAHNYETLPKPYRSYRQGYVFRNEKPGPGRFRQFMQFDADTVGAPGPEADAEMCMMMADVMDALGLAGQYVVRVNNRKVLDGVLAAAGVETDEQKLTVLRAIDKLDKFGPEGVRLLLGAGRKDESGDFTKGAGLSDAQIEPILAYVDSGVPAEGVQRGSNEHVIATINTLAGLIGGSETGLAGVQELASIFGLVSAAGFGGRVILDPSVVRGLEYYTGPVFEIELTFKVQNEKGQDVVFGSVGGGGRYDGLVSRFRREPVPATGFSIGVSRLMTALKNLGQLGQDEVLGPVLVTVMDGDVESMGRYQRFTQELRAAGIRAEMYQGNWKKFGNQLKYADRRGSPIAIIQGGDERAEGAVQIKDLIEGKRLSGEIEDNATWREARVAQEVVPEAELVAKVKEILAAQDEDRRRAKDV